ncbi:oxygen-independent coproporphyrinogen III oxidase [Nevskia soli]|uniref:oxygen-independent coproporphyrinogen III oxidase n=1 Tax=Nevskia soli TaxID=418856 RepID=UPI0004A6F096|nr:oxygen-independent coproporphyrinogen III oxidase [Nevskia soli]
MNHDPQTSPLPDVALIRKYDGHGPRYTSYPTAPQFSVTFGAQAHTDAADRCSIASRHSPLSLYVHIPFCASPCYYCACTKVITRKTGHADAYVARLVREVEMQARLFPPSREVTQLHFGGGTPTFLSATQLQRIFDALHRHFRLSADAGREFSIEIDPRTVDAQTLRHLATLGFNRASFGIQDFDPNVQRAVNRLQTPAQVSDLMDAARNVGFGSLSVDLIYGLPLQTGKSFSRTLEQVVALRPDRISAYSYAHMPDRLVPQRQIRLEDLPDAGAKLELLLLTTDRLLKAGYQHIGMDHFALPTDELAGALRSGTLQRNFQGYSTRGGLDLLGLGMSAISRLGDSYSQNSRTLKSYYDSVDSDRLPIDRGITLSPDDQIRRDVISTIMCGGQLDYRSIEAAHGLDFSRYFEPELEQLAALADDGLVELAPGGMRVTAAGRYLLRAVAMPFDAYLRPGMAATASNTPQYSKVI